LDALAAARRRDPTAAGDRVRDLPAPSNAIIAGAPVARNLPELASRPAAPRVQISTSTAAVFASRDAITARRHRVGRCFTVVATLPGPVYVSRMTLWVQAIQDFC